MRFIFHGGEKEVGRSCIELQSSKGNFLFDCGIKMTSEGLEYPNRLRDLSDVDAIFLSHAHLDHTGGLPLLKHYGFDSNIFCTRATARIADILLKDSYHIDLIKNHHAAYSKYDIKSVEDRMVFTSFNEKNQFSGINYEFFNAGHIPGSSSIKLEVDGKSILYTGDINTERTELVKPADEDYGEVDVLITESTYGSREHEDRDSVEERFVDEIIAAQRRGGSVIIPVFGVGRAQEILCILDKYNFEIPIYLDGMARRVTDTILKNSNNLTDVSRVKRAYKKAKEVKNPKMREYIIKHERGIFVTTSGMLEGGPIMSYLKRFHGDDKSSLLMTGYQVEGTNGRLLTETGHVYVDGIKMRVRMHYEKFDFSAHSGKTQLHELVKKISPKQIIIEHGDPEEIKGFYEWCKKNTNSKVYAPEINDNLEL